VCGELFLILLFYHGQTSASGDTIQDAKQLFFSRLPQMTKHFVMRECEHIPTWISLSGDLAFSHQDGIYGFKFPKRFSELSQAKTSLYSLYLLY
jgi:hypothetical protein